MCQLVHLSRIHQNRQKESHVGGKVNGVVHLDKVEVVFSLDQICAPVNDFEVYFDPPANSIGQLIYGGLLAQSDSPLISLTTSPDDLPPRV